MRESASPVKTVIPTIENFKKDDDGDHQETLFSLETSRHSEKTPPSKNPYVLLVDDNKDKYTDIEKSNEAMIHFQDLYL